MVDSAGTSLTSGPGAAGVGVSLTETELAAYGSGIHWLLGIGAGAAYGVLRGRVKRFGFAHGLGFGSAFWLLIDETLNPLLGLTPGPAAFPWQAHGRGLAGHLVFGAVADTTLDLLDHVA